MNSRQPEAGLYFAPDPRGGRGYALAAVVVAAAVLLRWEIPGILMDTPYLAFYPTVVIAALLGGAGPGIFATIASALCIGLLFDPTPGWNHFRDVAVLVRLGLFLIGGLGTSLAVGAMYASRAAARERAVALQESERRFRTFFENPAVGAARLDQNLRLADVNDRYCQITGYSRDELLGRSPLELVHPDDRAADGEVMNRLHASDTGVYSADKRYIRKDGQMLWVHVTAGTVRDAQGNMLGTAAIVVDITLRKQAEEQLIAAKHSAEQAREVAEQAGRAKDHFLAVLSHELRNPLTPVLATAAMLQRDPTLRQDLAEQIEVIRRNAELEAHLINDLLDVTRIARGKVELAMERAELGTVIGRAIEVCKPDIEARALHLQVDWGPRPYWVDADVGRMQQVFWNLLSNAAKFTPHGGSVAVKCSRSADGPQVMVEVIDNGIGIPQEMLPAIFNPFEQVERTITRQFGGLGLGLTICKAMVELHGGTIEAHSEGKGKGSTFRVRLPMVTADASLAGGEQQPAGTVRPMTHDQEPTTPLRILVVEDHGDTARIMQRMLRLEGHEVAVAADIATALSLAEERDFDLLLSDLGLPDGSGVDLMRALRERGRVIPGIALSGFGQEEDVRRSKEAGFAAHLVKPTNPDLLTRTIGTVTRPGAAR